MMELLSIKGPQDRYPYVPEHVDDLGIEIHDMSPDTVRLHGRSSTHGVFVSAVVKESVGGAAGLRAGDIIMKMNGETLIDKSDFKNLVAEARKSSEAKITIFRHKQPLDAIMQFNAASRETPTTQPEPPPKKETAQMDVDLHQAAASGNAERCRQLLALGADINSRADSGFEETPLIVAVRRGAFAPVERRCH